MEERTPEILVQGITPELWELRFVRKAPEGPAPTQVPVEIQLNLTLSRPHSRHLVARLAVEIEGPIWSNFAVAYHTGYFVRGEVKDDELHAVLLQLGTRSAPLVLYPFVREAVVSTAQRAGGLAVNVPMMDFSSVEWNPPIGLPEPEGETPPEFLEPLKETPNASPAE